MKPKRSGERTAVSRPLTQNHPDLTPGEPLQSDPIIPIAVDHAPCSSFSFSR